MRTLRAVGLLTGVAILATGTSLAVLTAEATGAGAASGTAFSVYVGYADCPSLSTCSASTITNPDFPQPWFGATGWTFVGDPTVYNLANDTDPDTTAIRVDNTGANSVTVDDVSVSTCNGGSLDLWGTAPLSYPYTLASGANDVFTSTDGDNFDGSDICNADATVTVDVNGVTTSYSDDIANGGGGAVHGGSGTPFGDESTPWTKLTPGKEKVTLVPAKLAKGAVGTTYGVIVAAQGSNGAPVFSLESGSLPPGLTLTPDADYHSAADISGTPTKAGTYSFTLKVKDSNSPKKDSGSAQFQIKIKSS